MKKVVAFTCPTADQDYRWSFEIGFNLSIDFCIWTLEEDGFQVPLLDRHIGGTRSLQAVGMNEVNWQAWFSKVVLLQDSRLRWGDPEEQQRLLSKSSPYFSEAIDINLNEIGIDVQELGSNSEEIEHNLFSRFSEFHPKFEEAIERRRRNLPDRREDYSNWMEQQYQHALEDIRHCLGEPLISNELYGDAPEIWNGEQAVKEQLETLWNTYQTVLPQRYKKCAALLEQVEPSVDELLERLHPYYSQMDNLNLYLTSYPTSIEYLIPSVSVVLTVSEDEESDDSFTQRVLNAVENLVSLSNP